MEDKKKTYISPDIESERVDLPQAWACTIFNANSSSGTWSGSDVMSSPEPNCW